MKVYSVLYVSIFGHKQDDVVHDVFPRAFRTREEAHHAATEDALENWDEYMEDEPFPGLTACEVKEGSNQADHFIEFGDTMTTYTIVEQDFE